MIIKNLIQKIIARNQPSENYLQKIITQLKLYPGIFHRIIYILNNGLFMTIPPMLSSQKDPRKSSLMK
jgi:uncharacterized membrane protein